MSTVYHIPGATQGYVSIVDVDDDGIIGDEDCVSVTPGLCSSFSDASVESIVQRQLGISAQQLKGTHLPGLVRYFTRVQAAEEAAQEGNAPEMVRLLTDAESESETGGYPLHINYVEVATPHAKEVLQRTYDKALVDAAQAFKDSERARSKIPTRTTGNLDEDLKYDVAQERRLAYTFAPHWGQFQDNVYLAERCYQWGAGGNEQELKRLRHLAHRDVHPACFPSEIDEKGFIRCLGPSPEDK